MTRFAVLWLGLMLYAVSFPEAGPAAGNAWLAAQTQPKYAVKRCELPPWFRVPPHRTDSLNLVVGISDPGLSPAMAEQQAIARLKIMAALGNEVHIYFNNSLFRRFIEETTALNHHTDQSKFVRFSRMQAALELQAGDLQIMDSTTTVYGEKIVFAHYAPQASIQTGEQPTEQIQVEIDFMAIEVSHASVFSTDQFLHLQANINNLPLAYTMYKAGEIAELISTVNGQKFPFPFDYYKYLLSERIAPAEGMVSAKLYYGLWKAFIESYCMALSNYHFEHNIRQQFVQDTYQEMIMSLSREITEVRLNPGLMILDAGENELHLQLDFE